MRLDRLFRTLAPAFAMAAAGGLAGCDGAKVQFGGTEGVPLADLDLSGDPPSGVTMAGPDNVVISRGDSFTVNVEGGEEAQSRLRFFRDDGMLGISREDGSFFGDDAAATVRVTMPAPRNLVMAGSGRITSEALAEEADIVVAGSGEVQTPQVAARRLNVTIAGSGTYEASGTTERLDMTIAGSGDARMGDLSAERVDITIAGSGDAVLASDGEVSATFMGSGNVTVRGSARCKVSSFGSGTLTCERGVSEE